MCCYFACFLLPCGLYLNSGADITQMCHEVLEFCLSSQRFPETFAHRLWAKNWSNPVWGFASVRLLEYSTTPSETLCWHSAALEGKWVNQTYPRDFGSVSFLAKFRCVIAYTVNGDHDLLWGLNDFQRSYHKMWSLDIYKTLILVTFLERE